VSLSAKVKTSLDETRTLMLGAQILLGFQFHAAFQQQFDDLPPEAKAIEAVALALMVASVSLLIAPSAFHRIVDRGESTGRTQAMTSVCASAALVPFAVALGLDLSVTLARVLANSLAGITAGTGFAMTALVSWFGLGWIMKSHFGAEERRNATSERDARETAPLHSRIEQMLTEARVILPGAQALLGFQLAIVLTDNFEKLPTVPKLLHATALLCVALSVALLMTPAAIHRIVWAGEDSEALLRSGGRITVFALLPLAIGMAGDSYVVLIRMLGAWLATIAAPLVLLCLVGLWFAWPMIERRQRDSDLAQLGFRRQQPAGER
jgi:Family of unknown function (DUF6328)